MRRTRDDLTADDVRGQLHYAPDTGAWTWLVPKGRCAKGSAAGSVDEAGYLHIGIDGHDYLGHRLAHLYVTGAWPDGDLDHRDTDPANGRWINLRQATASQNIANSKLRKNNTSGFKGVTWDAQTGRWRAGIKVDYRRINLGRFTTAEAASAAYLAAAHRHFGEFARAA